MISFDLSEFVVAAGVGWVAGSACGYIFQWARNLFDDALD
jgi:hypothetical protein